MMKHQLNDIAELKGKSVIEVFDFIYTKIIICEDSFLCISIDHGYYDDYPIISISEVKDLDLKDLKKLSSYNLFGVSERIELLSQAQKEQNKREKQLRRQQYEKLKKEFEE